VQRTTAHTITKKTSSPEICTPDPSCFFTVKVPELCDREAIRKPISPLAIMANPTSKAIVCGGLGGICSVSAFSAWGVAGRDLGSGRRGMFRLLWLILPFFLVCNHFEKYSKYITRLTRPLAMVIKIEYMMPFQMIDPWNISVIGMEKPIDACKPKLLAAGTM
jgi:hypothetical protein